MAGPAVPGGPPTAPAGLRARDLTVTFATAFGELPAISQVCLDLVPGQITGLVGESGSGKSTLGLALLNAVPPPGRVTSGSVQLGGAGDTLTLSPAELRRVRGAQIGYLPQGAHNSFNPLKRLGQQLLDLGRSHGERDLRGLLRRASVLLADLGLDPAQVLASCQHELSGGARQRAGIAFALVLDAHVVVLDEPTTALDMLSQAAVLRVVRQVHADRNLSTLVISHDLGVIGELADHIAVMYAGRLVEEGPTGAVLTDPRHPYTRGLLTALPRVSGDPGLARPLPGQPPDLSVNAHHGCVFRGRCPIALARCTGLQPPLALSGDHRVACHAVQREGQ